MKLISSADTLNFLSKSAPRPWVKRMLRWMIYDDELPVHFSVGRIVGRTSVASIKSTIEHIEKSLELSRELDWNEKQFKKRFDEEFSKEIVGRDGLDLIDDEPIEWDVSEEPHRVGPGFFIYTEEVNWEAGSISTVIFNDWAQDDRLFWDAEEHFGSIFEDPTYDVRLSGMCFVWENIEMLQPGLDLDAPSPRSSDRLTNRGGRPRAWDWEGAMAHLLGIAQHPDGLPTGPGAQAQIEKLMAEWFVATKGDSPSSSQLRIWARKVTTAIETSET